ncbi:MAG: hypothetical protein AAFY31_05860 [Pseudomonadota bacterium]
MSLTEAERQRLLDAVVSLAAQDRLGEEQFWGSVEPALIQFIQNPVADRDLRRYLPRINDTEVVTTLEDWFTRAAGERARDERNAKRFNTEIVTPIKRLGFTGVAAGVLGTALGSSALPIALPVIAGGLILGGGGIQAAMRLTTRADDAASDAERLKRLAEICLENRKSRTRATGE